MDKSSITVNGEKMFFCNKSTITKGFAQQRRRVNSDKGKGNNLDICPFCNETVQEGEEVYMVISNNKLLPNVFGHTHCIEIPEYKLIEKCEELIDNYQQYLNMKKIWG